MDPSFIPYRRAAKYLKARLANDDRESPEIGIICGSGLSGLSHSMTEHMSIKYGDIPGFPAQCSVPGHKGELVFGNLSGDIPTVCLRGRFHSYEGHDMGTVALPVRVMRCLGVKFLIVTNAAGGLDATYNVGDVVSIMDHFALPMLAGKNPLIGPNDDELGPRFPPSSNTYDQKNQAVFLEAAVNLGFENFVRKDGLYCFVSGPMYESKAECNFFSSINGSAVGMSTVPETITAHHCGMKVMCLSLITNKVIRKGDEGPAASHEEVLEAVEKRAEQMQDLVKEIVNILRKNGTLSRMKELPPVDLDTKESGLFGINVSPLRTSMNAPIRYKVASAAIVAVVAVLVSRLKQ